MVNPCARPAAPQGAEAEGVLQSAGPPEAEEAQGGAEGGESPEEAAPARGEEERRVVSDHTSIPALALRRRERKN